MTQYEFEEFTPDDLRHLNMALRAFPNVAYGLRAVVSVTSRLTFPVEEAGALRDAINAGGIRYGDSDIPVEHLADLMPEYYFPIHSEEDFISKVADVCAREREPAGRNMPAAALIEANAERRGDPPTTSDDQIFAVAGITRGTRTPGVGGLTKHGRERE